MARSTDAPESLADRMEHWVARFADRVPDWEAFEEAKIPGFHRAQHRYVGAGASGKHADPLAIPPGNFTVSVMLIPPGQGNPPHTHEVEEVFFVLDGNRFGLRTIADAVGLGAQLVPAAGAIAVEETPTGRTLRRGLARLVRSSA